MGHLRTKGLKVGVAAGEEHASDCVQKNRGVLLVDKEWREGLFGADYAAHSGEEAVAFHIRHIPRVVWSNLRWEGFKRKSSKLKVPPPVVLVGKGCKHSGSIRPNLNVFQQILNTVM